MTDLKHWLDDASDADDFERSILRAGLGADPPHGKEGEVWSSLVGTLAIAPVAVAAGVVQGTGVQTAVGSASKAAAVWLGVGKGFVVGLAVYGAAAGVSEIAERLSARRSAAAPANFTAQRKVSTAPRTAPMAPPATPEASAEPAPAQAAAAPTSRPSAGNAATGTPRSPETSSDATPLPSVAAFPEPRGATRESQLQAEAAALRNARSELRAGKLADAFATLEASQRQFTAPELYQEREALLIELLSRSGRTAAARERARAFLARFPDSPHADPLRQLLAH